MQRSDTYYDGRTTPSSCSLYCLTKASLYDKSRNEQARTDTQWRYGPEVKLTRAALIRKIETGAKRMRAATTRTETVTRNGHFVTTRCGGGSCNQQKRYQKRHEQRRLQERAHPWPTAWA